MTEMERKEYEIVGALESFAEGDTQFLVELIQIYLRNVPDEIAEIKSALALGDVPLVRRHIHDLAGASGNIGTQEGLDCCRRMTAAAHAGNLEQVRVELDCFVKEYAPVERILTKLLDHYSHAA